MDSQDAEVPAGVEAVSEHGLQADDPRRLLRERLVVLSLADMRELLARRSIAASALA